MPGFWLNGKWTFAGKDAHVGRHGALRFERMWLALVALNTLIVGGLDHRLGLRDAQVLEPAADLLSGKVGFLSRHWVHRR